MNERIFRQEDLLAFARLSGDYNPIHTDPIQARRLLFNSTVAHGVLVLMWALDCGLRSREGTVRIRSIRSKFTRPVRIGEPITCSMRRDGEEKWSIEIVRMNETATTIEVVLDHGAHAKGTGYSEEDPERSTCRIHSIDTVAELNGAVPLHLDRERLSSLFPEVAEHLDPVQVSQLLATTRVIGMECPGLHSVYSGLDLDFADRRGSKGVVKYEVVGVDDRMGRVDIRLRGDNLEGSLTAFLRPRPMEQAGLQDLENDIVEGEFESQRALVVGGSRGIGEVVVKLLAVGGADVHFTYNQGEAEAERIVREIRSRGGLAASSRLNVVEPDHDVLDDLMKSRAPTHLYYFPSPPIFVGAHKVFSPPVFSRFCRFYVEGFIHVVDKVMTRDLRGVFFPSSVAIEELPANMGEYVAAKAAGEALCSLLEKWYPECIIRRPRLPRMRTDQTVTLLRDKSPAPQDIMLHHLREFHGATKRRP